MHDEFPVSIDLAITPPEPVDLDMVVGKKGKSKPMYPSLYISGVKNIEDLPREGYALIHFKRRSMTMGERDGEECCSADLEIHEIRLPEKGAAEEMGDMEDAMTSLAKERGLIEGADDEMDDEEMGEEEEGESLATEMEEDEEE